MSVSRGEVYWLDFDPVKGSEQAGLRPALIIQNDLGNRYGRTTVVAAIPIRLTGRIRSWSWSRERRVASRSQA